MGNEDGIKEHQAKMTVEATPFADTFDPRRKENE